ncbi:DUF1249 domain-containing protein [Vreelandella massiliensis]|uniref:DUF1249 domain-containing protein n=1 Tax=Vreelandella massiliensis TaxID=1816686 RepID=UPI00096A300D|nr:DUF1249 domain-containing protein [Halomonas massiliensis]MYL22662.1 DUF1249 domain-containing protein [Halomonas alkaliantarctica]
MAKTAYVTDLKSLQGECSANYLRLIRLVGDMEQGQSRDIPLSEAGTHALHLYIQENAPYTTMIQVSQTGPLDHVLESPRMRVHLYHDVRMAEVTDFQRERHFHGRYRYPNPRMHQPDEKLQLNRFLGEWLAHGLAHGRSEHVPEMP